ncbi:MAG: hypothetical protein M1586_00035 [Patescibacteria group bacterium]|nr:hypothetical protein [Patescibacteria group bacterium]MCL5261680.1 hypothetical protein [Patescibacteria group bacterium]
MAEYLTQYQELANDIAAATFRVAELIKQDRLKAELHLAVFDLVLAGSDRIITRLKALIRFGQSIQEIKDINAEVLLRELGHLEGLAKEVAMAETDVTIEDEFVDKQYGQVVSQMAKWPNRGMTRPTGHVMAKPANQGTGRPSSLDQVWKFMETRPETRFKDLEQAFGHLSSRTLRRVIEQLRKSGKIERVGNPGPASFYRATTGVSQAAAVIPLPKSQSVAESALPENPGNRNPETIIAL